MATRKLVIINGKLAKEFEIRINKFEEIENFIEYYNGSKTSHGYIFNNPVSFQIVDLYLSSFATPQPS